MENENTYSRCTSSVQETKELAATLVPFLRAGDVVLLEGDLGAGKTQFVQAVADGLGVAESVVSPTFNIVISYQGDELDLNHFDLYRLDADEELDDIGYWEMLEGGGVSIIEWGSKFPDSLPDDYLNVRIECTGVSDRWVSCSAHGNRAASLLADWAGDSASGLG